MGRGRGSWFAPWFHIGILLLAALQGALSLKGVQIRVPEAVAAGETVQLACDYDLEQAVLYSIKWYRGDQEFYRFVPKESPPTRVFPAQGINVDISQSNHREVTLQKVTRDLTAFYKCEVSADAPLFHTEIKTALMIVAELPTEKPRVSVEKLKYSQGERIRANCTSPAAYPAVNLTWFLNGKEVWTSPPHARVFPPQVEALPSEPSTISSALLFDDAGGGGAAGPNLAGAATGVGGAAGALAEPGMELELEPPPPVVMPGLEAARGAVELEAGAATFVEGRARLRCLATLFTLYRRTDEVELTEDTPQIAPVMGPTAPHSLDFACRTRGQLHAVLSIALLLVLASR